MVQSRYSLNDHPAVGSDVISIRQIKEGLNLALRLQGKLKGLSLMNSNISFCLLSEVH